MLNPIFEFINKYPTFQKALIQRFNLKLTHKTFNKSTTDYLLLDIPCENTIFSLQNKHLVTTQHHFTIPQHVDKKTNSVYHYSLVLTDSKAKKEYKIRLYFDSLDRITIEPKLFDATESDNPSFSNITSTNMEKILQFAMPATAIITFLREAQHKAVSALTSKVEATENELVQLSEDLESNKHRYIERITEQISTISKLESIGCIAFKKDKVFYVRLLETLNRARTIEPPIPEQSETVYREDKALNTSVINNQPNTDERKAKTDADQQSKTQLIQACQRHIDEFDKAAKPLPKLILNMINKIVECKGTTLFSKDAHACASFLKIKSQLASRIGKFFKRAELAEHLELYLQAVKANILPLSNQFILMVLKSDNVVILKKIIELNVVTDSTKINLLDGTKSYTLVEWCVYFNSLNCFNELLRYGFSLDYIDEQDSPFIMLLDDTSKYNKFFSTNIVDITVISRLATRIMALLEERRLEATGDNAALISIQMESIKICAKINVWLSKNQIFKYTVIKYCNYLSVMEVAKECKDPRILEQLRRHLGLQQEILSFNKQFCELLKSKTSRKFDFLKMFIEYTESAYTFKNIFHLPVDKLIEKFVIWSQLNTNLMNLACENYGPNNISEVWSEYVKELDNFYKSLAHLQTDSTNEKSSEKETASTDQVSNPADQVKEQEIESIASDLQKKLTIQYESVVSPFGAPNFVIDEYPTQSAAMKVRYLRERKNAELQTSRHKSTSTRK